MSELNDLIEQFAENSNYTEKAEKFLHLDRWTGDNPLLMLADAAGTTTGQNYFEQVKPSVKAFQDKYLNTCRIESMESLAQLNPNENTLVQIFEAERKRRVLIEGASVFATQPGTSDLDRLQQWAQNADPSTYSEDPFGSIRGVGLRTFQYLRIVAGVDTVKPDIQVHRFVEALADATGSPHLDASTDQAVLQSCAWIADHSEYRMIELDQIAWWHFSDSAKRHP